MRLPRPSPTVKTTGTGENIVDPVTAANIARVGSLKTSATISGPVAQAVPKHESDRLQHRRRPGRRPERVADRPQHARHDDDRDTGRRRQRRDHPLGSRRAELGDRL